MMVDIKIDTAALAAISSAAVRAAALAMETVKTDLVNSQSVPFDTGTLQGSIFADQFRDGDDIHTTLQTDGPQARRLYFHPEYNFQRGNNPNAGAEWYAPYLPGGSKEHLLTENFEQVWGESL